MTTRLLDICKTEPTVPLARKIIPFFQAGPVKKVAALPHAMSPFKQVQLDVYLSEWALFSHRNTSRMFCDKKKKYV